MCKIKFVGIDPSLTNTGLVWGHITKQDDIVFEGWGLIQTKARGKKKIAASNHLIDRCEIIYKSLSSFLNKHKPRVVFAETPSGSQNYHAAISYAVSCFALVTIEQDLVDVTPRDIKLSMCGKEDTSKEEIVSVIQQKYSYFNIPMRKLKGEMVVNMSKAEHVCDAAGAVITGIKSKKYRDLKTFL
jgi:Holliday junction resolvasome RuvABC endonuclease subunit